MRRDKQSGKLYASYFEWLRDGHLLWLASFVFGYVYYLTVTEPVVL
jgi:hypothetical protein